MSKKLDEKTAGISLDGFQPRNKVIDGQSPALKPHTGVGMVIEAMVGKDEVSKKLDEANTALGEARQKLSTFDGAVIARPLDPKSVQRSRWANRNVAEWATTEFQTFKSEIAAAGGNVQSIKVRMLRDPVIDGQSPIYEIVYGHRRHRACLELGLPVNAVVVESMSDKELFAEMDRENRGRKNLSAWEQGTMYQDALKEGLFPSIRQLAEANGVNLSDAVRWIQLAKLPAEVIEAFPSPLDLQVRWAKPLADAYQQSPEGVLTKARELKGKRGQVGATEVFEQLIGKSPKRSGSVPIHIGGKLVASVRSGPKGRAVIEFESGALPESRQNDLAKVIEKFLAQ